MICQIIDSVDNHFGEYLWHFLFIRLYSWHNSKEPANCKLIHETVQHAELSQTRDAIRWHQAPKPKLFYIVIIDRFLYSTILRFRANSLRSHVILHEWIAFYSAFLNIHRSGVLTALAWLVPHETAAISARSVYTIQPCTMSLHAKPHT